MKRLASLPSPHCVLCFRIPFRYSNHMLCSRSRCIPFSSARSAIHPLLPPHRYFTTSIPTAMRVIPVPCLSDNYAYVLVDDNGVGLAVDPVEPRKVIPVMEKENVKISGILTTHHHADHAGGNKGFLHQIPNIPVWGGDDRIPGLTEKVVDRAAFTVGELHITPLYTLCHTLGSVSFYVEDKKSGEKAIFTGDTLFVAGCGKFFEGTPEQMHNSLYNVLGQLPAATKVYVGHEYTKSNLKFAVHVDGQNPAVVAKAKWVESNTCTVPSTIGDEKTFNPFLRCDTPSIREAVGLPADASVVEVLGALRKLKDCF
ncbi:hydroxyacylglutathione hydrolase [Fimicolochytrium jonesii]|uniref:hydroxyacylglutathione hydrolase n=1 Tax=Fimicolochytrium jonesii TaxID=1396493 RepID=UPI0022FDB512|nr:hydroxyacylglutathione hydrolase [Fimicolochytrium jonesii]KAI8821641.1 hydroxyacylglutathione hydrolase [Fimicolochytrium jonesii]